MITSQHMLYVGGYALADQAGIHGCIFDDVTGKLEERSSFAGIVNPSFWVSIRMGTGCML